VWDSPAAERLVIPFETKRQSAGSFYVVHRRQDRARPLVRAFADWLASESRTDLHRMQLREKAAARRSKDAFAQGNGESRRLDARPGT
jgi:hypothetical protein